MRDHTTNHAKADQAERSGWWPASYAHRPRRPDRWTPKYTPQVRRDLIAWSQWGTRATVEDIRLRHLSTREAASEGERIALAVLFDATYWRPTEQSPAEWLDRLRAWDARHGGRATSEHPPWPWDRDQAGMSQVYCTLSRSTAIALTHRKEAVENV